MNRFATFYDLNPDEMPEDATYYHNVYVIAVAVSREMWDSVEELQDITCISYLDEVCGPAPCATFIWVCDEEFEDDVDFEVETYDHSVVEVRADGDICWYDGKAFDEGNPWRL